MKKLTLIILAILSISAAAAQGRITWLETEHDFGVFNESEGNKTCTMRFVNTGNRHIAILSARASCGCTQPKYPKEAIAPGDTAQIEITYMPEGRPGRFEKIVTVIDNTSNHKSRLTIKGVVVGTSKTITSHYPIDGGSIRLKRDIIPFKEVMKIRNKTEFIDAYNISTDTLYPEWDNIPEYITITGGMKYIAPGDYASFAISFNATKCGTYGLVKDVITMYPNGKAHSAPIKIEVYANVVEDFSTLNEFQLLKAPAIAVSPEKLDFGLIAPPMGLNSSFTITNTGKSEMIIRRIYSTDPAVNISYSKNKVKAGKDIEINVTLNPFGLPKDILNTFIYIITNCPDNPVIEYRLVGEIAK